MQEPREEGDGQESPPDAGVVSNTNWQPNPEYLKVLIGMGISRNAAEKALFYTDNRSPDLAAAWIFENSEGDLETPLEAEAGELSGMCKMVFVVNCSLEMGTGKLAAQVAHGALGMHRLLLQDEGKYGQMLLQWGEDGETKIVLKGENTRHLIDLERKAMHLGLPSFLVQDAGRTQVPAGSTTVLCIMGRIDLIDEVTGSLRLL